MKKSFRLVSLLLVAVLLLPSLVACKGNERPISEQISAIADDKGKALFLLDTADENLKKLQSYTGTETMTIGIPVNGQSLDLSTTTVLEIERQNKADFIGKLHETATVKSGDVTSLQEVVTGYQDGQMYYAYLQNGSVQTEMRSGIDTAEAQAFLLSRQEYLPSASLAAMFGDFSVLYHKRTSGYTVKFANFSQEFLRFMILSLDLLAYHTAVELRDVVMYAYFDENGSYEKKTLSANIVYGVSGEEVVLPIKAEVVYEKNNSTSVEHEVIAHYESTPDLRILHALQGDLEDYKFENAGKFEYRIFGEEYFKGELKKSASSAGTVTYQTENGRFRYEYVPAKSETPVQTVTRYADGKRIQYRVYSSGNESEWQSWNSTDNRELLTIGATIDPWTYSIISVSQFTQEESEDGEKYCLTLVPSSSIIASYTPSDAYTYRSGEIKVFAVYQNGNLQSYEAKVELTYFGCGYEYTCSYESTTTFLEIN